MKLFGALMLALILASTVPTFASDPETCNERCMNSWQHELWLFGTCYGNGFLCWRAWGKE